MFTGVLKHPHETRSSAPYPETLFFGIPSPFLDVFPGQEELNSIKLLRKNIIGGDVVYSCMTRPKNVNISRPSSASTALKVRAHTYTATLRSSASPRDAISSSGPCCAPRAG